MTVFNKYKALFEFIPENDLTTSKKEQNFSFKVISSSLWLTLLNLITILKSNNF